MQREGRASIGDRWADWVMESINGQENTGNIGIFKVTLGYVALIKWQRCPIQNIDKSEREF